MAPRPAAEIMVSQRYSSFVLPSTLFKARPLSPVPRPLSPVPRPPTTAPGPGSRTCALSEAVYGRGMERRWLGNEEETQAFGRALAGTLKAGSVVALVGGLGAGKTQVAKGIVAGLGYEGAVTSPTFALVHEYVGSGARLPAYHFDFYRLEGAGEALSLGWDDYVEAGGVCVVEWADLFPELVPPGAQWWRLAMAEGGDGRWVERVAVGDAADRPEPVEGRP